MNNGTRNQLREENDKQQVVRERTGWNLPSIGINQIGDLLEGVKADAERQNDVSDIPMRPEKCIAIVKEKTRILKVPEQSEVE